MPNPVLIVKNHEHEGPGLLEVVLKENAIPYVILDLSDNEPFPSLSDHSAMVVLGGTDSANDDSDKIKKQIEVIQEAIESRIPYFGVCLGLHLLVKAAGGTVRKNEVREVAFRDKTGEYYVADVTEEGKKDPLMAGLDDMLPMFHLHGETVELTKKMTLLASGEWCVNQIVRVAPTMYGIQGHMELTDELFRIWCENNDWLKECHKAILEDDWAERKELLDATLRTLFGNFLSVAGLL